MLVGPATAARYHAAVVEFKSWAAVQGESLETPLAVDITMEKYFEHLYWAGEPALRGKVCRCGWLWVHRLGRGSACLPHAYDAVRGWVKAAPEVARKPCPWVAVLAGARYLATRGVAARHAARGGLLQFDLFCRPSELLNLTAADVLPPGRGRKAYKQWAVVIAPSRADDGFEPAASTKAGDHDVTVIAVDDASRQAGRGWLVDLWKAALVDRSPDDRIVPLSLGAYERLWREAWTAVGCGHMKFCPHALRHGGASTDMLLGLRDAAATQKRGHWNVPSSVARYAKHGTLLGQFRRLPAGMQDSEASLTKDVHSSLREP